MKGMGRGNGPRTKRKGKLKAEMKQEDADAEALDSGGQVDPVRLSPEVSARPAKLRGGTLLEFSGVVRRCAKTLNLKECMDKIRRNLSIRY